MKRNVLIVIGVAMLAALALVQSFVSAKPREELPRKGFLAPQIELKMMDGSAPMRVGGPQDKPYIINFWAAWCDPCQIEAPDLARLYDRYKDRVQIYAVNGTKYDKLNDAKAFAAHYGFHFPVLLDEQGAAFDAYKIQGFPTSFFVDKNGVIQDILLGVTDPDELEGKLQKLIK